MKRRDLNSTLFGTTAFVFGRIEAIKDRNFLGENIDYNISRKLETGKELLRIVEYYPPEMHDQLRIIIRDVCPGKKQCQQSTRWVECSRFNTDRCPARHTLLTYMRLETREGIHYVQHSWFNEDFSKLGITVAVGDIVKVCVIIGNYYKGSYNYDYSFIPIYQPSILSYDETKLYENAIKLIDWSKY